MVVSFKSLFSQVVQDKYVHVVYNGKEGYVDPLYLQQEVSPEMQHLLKELDGIAHKTHKTYFVRQTEGMNHLSWFYSGKYMTEYPKDDCWSFSISHEYSSFTWDDVPQQNALQAANYLLRAGGWKVDLRSG